MERKSFVKYIFFCLKAGNGEAFPKARRSSIFDSNQSNKLNNCLIRWVHMA